VSDVAGAKFSRRGLRGFTVLVVTAMIAWPMVASAQTTTTTTTTLSSTTTTTTTLPVPTTWLGPDGVRSSAIIAENQLPGTSSWRIDGDDDPTAIEGFANLTDATVGENVNLYVTTTAPSFRAIAYRMGWYQGLGAREVWTSPLETGQIQPACSVADDTNMVSCANWSVSLTMPITSDFFPGDYLIKLTGGDRVQSYVLLTVSDPGSTATYVILNRSFVEQGWNTFGGYSFYEGIGPCILDTLSYPACNRARVVSFDRPYDTGDGASDFLTNEFPLVQYCEELGLDVTYMTDVELDQHPELLLRHKVLLSLDHDESWSYAERIAAKDAVAQGVNVVYFGAAAMVRHVRPEPSPLGPDREEVDYRDSEEDPLNGVGDPMEVTGNTWDSPPSDWPPTAQIGDNYSGYLEPGVTVPMVITDASSWVFRDTGLTDGSSLPGVIGSDYDHVISSTLDPPNLEVLAHSPIPVDEATVSGDSWDGESYSDMVYFTDPQSEAGVIDTGNNIWIGDLRPCGADDSSCASPIIRRITTNILWLFGQGPAGLLQPSDANAADVSPAGS
jgi:hypothetical protein